MDLKGVVLAGGTGSRLMPLTKVTNKHLLAVGKKPMIYYPIEKLISAGIEQILVITGIEHMGHVVSLLGSGKDFNAHFTYKVQDQAGGIAQALGLAENFAHGNPVAVVLGDNVFQDSLNEYCGNFLQQNSGARVLLKEVQYPQRFGVAHVCEDKVIRIEEKPQNPTTNTIVIGVYFYDAEVFDIIKTLKPSRRGELEITDVNNIYINNSSLQYDILKGWWTDAGTFQSLERANELVLREPPK